MKQQPRWCGDQRRDLEKFTTFKKWPKVHTSRSSWYCAILSTTQYYRKHSVKFVESQWFLSFKNSHSEAVVFAVGIRFWRQTHFKLGTMGLIGMTELAGSLVQWQDGLPGWPLLMLAAVLCRNELENSHLGGVGMMMMIALIWLGGNPTREFLRYLRSTEWCNSISCGTKAVVPLTISVHKVTNQW